MIYFFSGTGNSRLVAHSLALLLHDRVEDLAAAARSGSLSYHLQEGESLGFVFPVYSWGPPPVLLQLIESLCVEGKPGYVYAVCTCGDDAGRTMQLLHPHLERKGWRMGSAFSVQMPNTYVCLPGFDVDAPDVVRCKLEAVPGRLQHIASVVESRLTAVDEVHRGSIPWLKSYVVRPLFNRLLLTDKPFRTTDGCTACGLCVRRCPVDNMEMQHGAPRWLGHCAGCLCCYHSCPHHAIRFGRMTEHKGQYLCTAFSKIPRL